MSIDTFVAQRTARWQTLETLVDRARRGRLRAFSAEDVEQFGVLLRHATSDLAIARRDFPDTPVTEYLETLCSRAHLLLYRGTPLRAGAVPRFYAVGLPRAFRAARPYILSSLALLALGFVAGWIAVVLRPDLRSSLVPPSLFDEMARGDVHATVSDAPFAASFIIQNNIRVALICFAGGVVLGIPTVLVLLINGWMLGTIAAAVHIGGYDLQFWSLIVPHGVIELSVIVIAGGTGLMLGDAVLRPGLRRRADSLSDAARRGVKLAAAAATLLVIAGTLEAFVSPSALPDAAKLCVGAVAGTLLYAWLLLAGRTPRARRARVSLDVPAANAA